MNPLLELATRARPIEDAWGYTASRQVTLHVGAHEDQWLLARPERSLLVLGPPRDTGKTTSVLVPTVLVAFAPVVAASTKDDVFAATAQARALMGRLWHFAPDGTEPTPTGARKLRWSPVPAAADWDMAVTTAEVMVSVANATLGGHSADGGFWSIQAGGLLAPLLHAAALDGQDMRRHALGDAAGPAGGGRDPGGSEGPLGGHPHRLGPARRSRPHGPQRAVRLLGLGECRAGAVSPGGGPGGHRPAQLRSQGLRGRVES